MSVIFFAVSIAVSVILGIYFRMNMNQGLSPGDPNSFARPDKCVVKSVHLNWDVDFGTKKIKGYVDSEIERLDSNVNGELILDTRDLIVSSVVNAETSESLEYSLGSPVGSFGSKLEIKLKPDTLKVRVYYETVPSSTALQWMSPQQTAGKKHPYLFSQCQAIHARSLLPCQDTPSVKAPYTASVSVPKELVVLMSAVGDREHSSSGDKNTYKFHQKVPVPSYLIAIVVGALESRKIGPRSHVWSEKKFLDQSAYEFAETEDMLKAAESFLGPYVWGIYDLLVLPPSFPMGGMENPCLTFLTPTLLAGDRSLVDTVAHEIAHSWTGNLVTNQNYEHFWLNEGFTVFVERKINGKISNDEKTRQFQALKGWEDLQETVNVLGKDNPLTALVVDLKGVDPDDAFSKIPYEKGSAFLLHLEQVLGGKEVFEGFLRSYIEEYKYKSINTDDLKAFLYRYFKDKVDILNAVDWNGWLYSPGMPPVKPKYDDTLARECFNLSQKWIKASLDDVKSFTNEDYKSLSSSQLIVFLQLLLNENKPLPLEKFEKMTELYAFETNQNCEIRFRWLRLGVQSRCKNVVPLVLKFVTDIGRMKYVEPLYRDLYAWEEFREQAFATFRKNRPEMMHVCAHAVAKSLHLD